VTWFKVDDGFANSKPVLRIPRRYRTQAVGLWTLAGTWAAKELTDGYVPAYVLEDLAGTPAVAAHLVRAGLWEEAEGGWQFVGWSKYQPTKEQVLARRSEEAEKRKRGREAQRKRSEQQQSDSVPPVSPGDIRRTPPGQNTDTHCPGPARPVPSRPSSLVTKGVEVTSVDAHEPPPCPKHSENSETPCAACRKRRLWDQAQAEQRAADELHARRLAKERADDCGICHGTNWIPETDPAIRCSHQEVIHA
jgi:hypothetical protein